MDAMHPNAMHPNVRAVSDALTAADAYGQVRMLPDAAATAAALVDTALANYTEIWAAGGIPHAIFPTTYDELVRITTGTPAEVA